ncbi:T9SS type A sorting domain-containing protein [Moheibacter sediminis]|uniref:Por secretion system C-terminal sorting domain-containing protein n=1 Tax=Moheibacter sediminis TaxID=1434700 RepID=A0A1W2CHM8_9FLAO|nr:T9SS type A sorting domain-containing protein [Moheibacter sediminis]SMC84681.1 Por secretion system C-terminal sorting domain-containing protein [Moheibacter sediminis]
MKQIFILIFLILNLMFASAQLLEWHKVFDRHSFGGFAPISPAAVKDVHNSVYISVAENDTLKIYKYFEDGILSGILDTNLHFDKSTPMINLPNGEFAVVFRANFVDDIIYFLQFDSSLNVTRFSQLNFAEFDFIADPQNLIISQEQLFLTLFDGLEHQLYKLNNTDTPELLYSANVEIAFGEDVLVMENGNLIFSYQNSNQHMVRCVSSSDGSVVWEHLTELQHWQLRKYKVFNADNHLLKFTHDIVWQDSDAIGTFKVIKLDSNTGQEISSLELFPDMTCVYAIFDMVYNETNGNMYLAYFNSCNNAFISLLEFNPLEVAPLHSSTFEYINDPLNIGQQAHLSILDNGKPAFIYKKYIDETEHGNLFIVKLNSDLSVESTLEINFDPPNGSESIANILPVDGSKFLISGVIPNNDPFIFWEEVKYFTAMIDLGGIMSIKDFTASNDKLLIYPNPAKQFANVHLPEAGFGTLSIFNLAGQIVYSESQLFENDYKLNLSLFKQGNYVVNFSVGNKKYFGRLMVN